MRQATGARDMPLKVFRCCCSTRLAHGEPAHPGPGRDPAHVLGHAAGHFSIVRERERGTLEQLMVTPVSPVAVVLGKLLPYLVLGFVQLLLILGLMTTVFACPSTAPSAPARPLGGVLFALLSLGLLVSSWSNTQMEAIQIAQMFLLPSIMLSGYIFPLASLPGPLRVIAQCSRPRTSSGCRADHHPGSGLE